MENNYELNHQTTQAFDLYAHEIFQRQIEKRIDDEPFDFDQGFASELNLRKEISKHLSGWLVLSMPYWEDVKAQYLNAIKNTSLDSDKIAKYKAKFETLAKLYYCGDMLKTIDCAASTDLDVSNYLMALQYRLKGLTCGQKHTNPTRHIAVTDKNERFVELMKTPVYKYLSRVSQETQDLQTGYDDIFNIPINKLADELFNRIVALQYEADQTVTCPIQHSFYNGRYTRDWDYIHIKDNHITNLDQALEVANVNFKDWLDMDLHEQEIGRRLH